jgi:hypothetical protein
VTSFAGRVCLARERTGPVWDLKLGVIWGAVMSNDALASRWLQPVGGCCPT